MRTFCLRVLAAAMLLMVSGSAHGQTALRVAGVLGNTAGLSDRPFPYAYYTGIAADAQGRLYLAGSEQGIVVSDGDGRLLAVLAHADWFMANSLMVRAGEKVLFVGTDAKGQSALFRINTAPQKVNDLKLEKLLTGTGAWAISNTPDAAGRVVVGQADLTTLHYTMVAVDPAAAGPAKPVTLFTLGMPGGATRPWQHMVQVDADGSISVEHSGGVNFTGRFTPAGDRVGEVIRGQRLDGFRYSLNYSGALRRMDETGTKPAPGDCGSMGAMEIRKANQVIRVENRYYFVGRGGAVEAMWNGTNFQYTRRIGALLVDDLASANQGLVGIAYTAEGNLDVQHTLYLPREQPIGQLLDVPDVLHGQITQAVLGVGEELVALYGLKDGAHVRHHARGQGGFDLRLPQVQEIGQATLLAGNMLLADPKSGTIWQGGVAAWKTGLPGVVALAAGPQAVFAATPTQISSYSLDGKTTLWTVATGYKAIRRLAAAGDALYVCDSAGEIVDQLDAATGKLVARLGVANEVGSDLKHLRDPRGIAADANGVYIADSGNGRVLVATNTLWTPDIQMLPREDKSPIAAATITPKLPAAGRVSLNVFDSNNVTVRQVASAQPSEQPILWDGRDMYEQWAKPGTYRYNGIVAPKFSLRYVTSVEQSGTPPYRTADGTGSWGGVWGYVMDIVAVNADADSDIVVLWAAEEGEGGLVRMSQDGEVRWKQHLDWWMKANQCALASDGKMIYIAGDSAMNAPTGQTDYGGEMRRPMLWRVEAATGAKRLYAAGQTDQPMYGEYNAQNERNITSLTWHDGLLYLASPTRGMVFRINSADAKLMETMSLEKVAGMAFTPDGRALAAMGSAVRVLDAQGHASAQLTDAGGEIWAIEAMADGHLVATVGAPRHQVVYFDKSGKEVRALGKMGGRPLCGKMIPDSLLSPVGLCVTGNGKLFVAESMAPKRFTRWSPDGKLEKEFHGPYYYSGMFGVDEEEPEYIYADTHSDIIRYKVDYETGAWKVDHYWINAYKDSGVPVKWWPRIRHRNGHIYWCSGSGGIIELMDDRVRGIAAIYGGWVEKDASGNYQQATKNSGLKGTWSDVANEGRPGAKGWQVTDKPAYPLTAGGPQQGWGGYFDENFDCYMHDWSDSGPGGLWKIPVAEWQGDIPVYKWDQARQVAAPRVGAGLAHGSPGARTAFAAGGFVYGFNGGYNANDLPGVGHGHDWEFAQITKYDPATGKPLWHAGQRAAGFAAAGEHYCPTGPAGVIGDYLFWTDENSLVHAWDNEHGLYVDTLLEDPSRDPIPSPYTVWVELFNTRIFKHPRSGKVYLLAASDAIHVYEVLGTQQKPLRFSGEFELTAAGIDAAKAKLASRVVEKTRSLQIPRAPAALQIDGNLTPFAAAPAASVVLRPAAQGSARLLYDDRNLYLAVDVKDDSPWKNSGSDITSLFKTGDTVDLWLGPDNAKRLPGLLDTRFCFAPMGGKTVVVAFRPKVASGAKPVTFRSPSGEVLMDRVELLSTVPVIVKLTDGGYQIEAAIP